MVSVNNFSVVDRHNRPGVLQRVGLRTFFINNGEFVDPLEISAVTIHRLTANSTPNTILDDDGLVTAIPLMAFGTSDATDITGPTFSASNYDPTDANGNGTGDSCSSVSGIYRLSKGEFIVILDGTLDLSGVFNGTVIANGASAAGGSYIDVWTLKLAAGSNYQTVINEFGLFSDDFIIVTQPLLINARNNLFNREVVLGSKVDLKIGTEVTLANRDIDSSIKNIFANSVVTSAAVQIRKANEQDDLLSPFTVSSFANTAGLVDITSDNTLVFNWDTAQLSTIASNSGGLFGNISGLYTVQVEYTILNQKIRSEEFPLILRL